MLSSPERSVMSGEGPDGGDGRDRHVEIERIDPLALEDALSIIGEETRASIVVQLGELRTTDATSSNALSFSELMDRVGVRDSGRFNYHLEQLVGSFVKKDADGYSLRLPGQLLYEAIVAGTLTDRQAIEPFSVGDCPACGDDLSAAYHPDHLLTVECLGCETLFDAIHFPARGLEGRSTSDLVTAAYQRRHHKLATMRRGVCPKCGGVVERDLRSAASITYGSGSVDEMAGLETYATLECRGCHTSLVGHPANIALTTPEVVGFFAAHDRDVALSRWWDPPTAVARDGIEVLGDDPRTVAIPFEIDDDRLRITLDDDLQIVESDHADA